METANSLSAAAAAATAATGSGSFCPFGASGNASGGMSFYLAAIAFLVAVLSAVFFWNENRKINKHLETFTVTKNVTNEIQTQLSVLIKKVEEQRKLFDELTTEEEEPSLPTATAKTKEERGLEIANTMGEEFN